MILDVFAATLVFSEAISVVLAVILDVFAAIAFVFYVTLVSILAIALVFEVMLEVLDVILVLKAFSTFVALIISASILFDNVIVSLKLKIVFARNG